MVHGVDGVLRKAREFGAFRAERHCQSLPGKEFRGVEARPCMHIEAARLLFVILRAIANSLVYFIPCALSVPLRPGREPQVIQHQRHAVRRT
jgi:hypothetical protein